MAETMLAEVMAELAALEGPKIRAVNEKHGDDHGANLSLLRALAKRLKTQQELGAASAVADSKQTLLCTYLSAVLLVGLGLNSLFGWAWADPVAALVIAAIAVKEGRDAWSGDTCCAACP